MDEIERVVAPLGVAWIKRDGKWTKRVQPMPDDVDDWQHWDHGADGNPFSHDERIAPTTSLRWLAGGTSVDGAGSKVGLRIADGQVYYTGINYDVARRFRRDPSNDIFARDAFNGTLRWKRSIDGVPGEGDQPPRFALTALDGRVYCYPEEGGPLHALDAKTGETLVKFTAGPAAPPLEGWNKWEDRVRKIHFVVRVFDGKVLQTFGDTVYLSDAKTGKLLWKKSVGDDAAIGWAVAGGGKIVAAVSDWPLIKNRASHLTPADRIVALDAGSGDIAWQYKGLAGNALFRMIYFRDSIIIPAFSIEGLKPNFSKNPIIVRLSADDGTVVWTSQPKADARGHYSIAMARGDEVIVGQQIGFGLDFATGELTNKYTWGQFDASCADLKCVPGYMMYGLAFIDNDGNLITRGQTRTICDVGLFPAYGLLYGSPLGCLCSEYINGYPVLAAEEPLTPTPDDQRITRGPAFGTLRTPHSARRTPQEWPLHMADARRSNWSPQAVAEQLDIIWQMPVAKAADGPIAQDWKDNEKIVGPLSAPTVAAGKLFVAEPDAHRLHALQADTGKPVWTFTASARIDSPPTILHAGDDALCLFGSRDGYVYCLRATDGELVWKFLCGQTEKYICVQSQLESAWPVFGSVMVDDDGIVVTAGRQSAIDGGIRVCKLRPSDGQLLWQTKIWNDPDKNLDSDEKDVQWGRTRNRRVNELLVSDGKQVCLWITPLKDKYADSELVDTESSVYAARSLRFSVPSKDELRDIQDAAWLRSASSNGLLSRRTDGVGRYDEDGVAYAQLQAKKICLAGHEGGAPSKFLYALQASAGKSKELRGGLIRVALNDGGTLPERTEMSAKSPPDGIYDAMILAGNRVYIAYAHPHSGEATLYTYSADSGEPIGEVELPARIVRDGMAAAYGKLYLAGENGAVFCLGMNDASNSSKDGQ